MWGEAGVTEEDMLDADAAKQVIRRAAAAGYRICVATGRNYPESRSTIERLGVRDECVFVGGAIRKRGGKLVGVDLARVGREAQASRDFIVSSAATM